MEPLSDYEFVKIWDSLRQDDKFYNTCFIVSIILKQGEFSQYHNYSFEALDRVLFQNRIKTFGSIFHNYSKCPKCKEELEWSFDFENLNLPDFNSPKTEEFSFVYKHSNIKFRLPSFNDIILHDVTKIAENCIISINDNEDEKSKVSKELVQAVQKEMESVAPFSNISFNLNCSACNHSWIDYFSISAYFIDEINLFAKKVMFQVHSICTKYNWSEKEVLIMSEKRRNFYLGLINS